MKNPKYHHGGDIFRLARQQNVPQADIVDLSSNIAHVAPEFVLPWLEGQLASIHHLPEPYSASLLRCLANFYQVPQTTLVCGAGTTELIQSLGYIFATKTALLVQPTYSEYEKFTTLYQCKLLHHVLAEQEAFQFNPEPFSQIAPQAQIVFICNPNNPTGTVIEKETLLYLLQRFPTMVFVIDESYLPFVPGGGSFSLVGEPMENLVVLRSFSKIYAIPGLRVGWLYSPNAELVQSLQQSLSPWSVNSLAQGLAEKLVGLPMSDLVTKMTEIKKQFLSSLASLSWLSPYPSQTNYVLFKSHLYSAEALYAYFCKYLILIRNCSNFVGLDSSFIRLSIKDQNSMEKASTRFHQLDQESP